MGYIIRSIACLSLLLLSLVSYAESKPLRVVSLAPSLTNMVIELGGADQLVGILDVGTRPPEIANIESVGSYGKFSLEKLISLNPDLILIWSNNVSTVQKKRLTTMGYKIIESNPHTLDELADEIETIGLHIERAEQGKQLAQQMRQELAQLRSKYQQKKPITVFYQLWDNPLYTIGKGQIIEDALKTCGAVNVFTDLNISVPKVSIESILVRNPQAIIASDQKLLDKWQQWPQLDAVKNNQLLLFNNEQITFPNFAMLEATKELCLLLHQ